MEYKLTFQDGSSAYLAHYGVLGMHWGKWNDETAARYAHRGRKGSKAEVAMNKHAQKYVDKLASGNEQGAARELKKMNRSGQKMVVATEKHQAKIDKARVKLDEASRNALESGRVSVDPNTGLITGARTPQINNYAARYLRASKDPSHQRYYSRVNKAALAGAVAMGPWGAALGYVVADNTKKGQDLNHRYTARILEVGNRSIIRCENERRVGKEQVDALFEENFKNRKDVY